MIKKIAIFFFVAMLVITLGGFVFVANYGERGSGVSLTETREMPPFTKISLEEIGTVNVWFGDKFEVSVTTDDNLVHLVTTTVTGDYLKIRPVQALNPKVDLVIDVTLPKLSALEVAGYAGARIHEIDAESLDVELAGACGIDATGRVGKLSLELAGACRARLKSLEAKDAVVEIAGTGSAVVFATNSIDAEAAGFASITCHGSPANVKKDVAGISRVTITP